MARMLKDRGGIPAHGNQRTTWDENPAGSTSGVGGYARRWPVLLRTQGPIDKP